MGNFTLKISVQPQPILDVMTLYMVSHNRKLYNFVYTFALFATFFPDSAITRQEMLFTYLLACEVFIKFLEELFRYLEKE